MYDSFGMRVSSAGTEEHRKSSLRMDDLRVWDARSPDSATLESIAGKLHAAYAGRWTAAKNARQRKTDDRDQPSTAASATDGPLDGMPAIGDFVGVMAAVRDALSSKQRELRERLARVTELLQMAEKDKSDLWNVVHRTGGADPVKAEMLQTMLDREKKKSARLETFVDEMYAARRGV